MKIWNEANIQIEIRYTVGKDEYDQGKFFDPSMRKKKELAAFIMSLAKDFFSKDITVSVWVKPIRESVFMIKSE